MNAALVHYWLVNRRGGEAVLDAIAELLPGADLISHVVDPAMLTGPLAGRQVTETFIARLPMARRRYQMYLPLMPLALEMLDMSKYDLIVSSEAGPAKWVIPDPDAHHICYAHSPLRYIWDQRHIYMKLLPQPLRAMGEVYASSLRNADAISANRVDQFVANSNFVARRIEKYYRREAVVIHPPVDVERFAISDQREDVYLIAGEIRSYKGVDTAVRVCTAMNRRLVVIGGGDTRSLQKIAGPTVEFRGRVSAEAFRTALAQCRALLFPGVEDFGIVPVEAMASGRPVIARAKGGAMDSVRHGETGILYADPTDEGLRRAILAFEAEEHAFSPAACRAHSLTFSRDVFARKFNALLPA